MDKESDERKASTLLYCLGPEADDVLTSTNIEDADRKKYSKVIEKFDAHFKVQCNVIFERARFNKRDQLESESAEEYITTLYSLIDTCDYAAMKDEMLRDRLIGICDAPDVRRSDPLIKLKRSFATKKPSRSKPSSCIQQTTRA